MDDDYEAKFVSVINCISHVEVKEEVIIPDNSNDSESTLSDNEKNSDSKCEECSICCKYRSMFIILKNHDCESVDKDEKCSFCREISHWSLCFKDHKESHCVESDPSSDSTTSDREENDRDCKVCLKYEFMVPLLKSHDCQAGVGKCQGCSEVLHWMDCYKQHAASHDTKTAARIKEENSSDSTTSDNEEVQRLLARVGKGGREKCQICLKYQVMLIILEENHACQVESAGKKCEECSEIFHWYKCFEKHRAGHSKAERHSPGGRKSANSFGGKFDCGICLKLNSIVTNLVKNHTCVDNRTCSVCQEMSYWLSCLKNHKRSELKSEANGPSDWEEPEMPKITPREPNCGVCSKFRAAILNLGDHVCRNNGRQRCEVCAELSFWTRNYKNHENHHEKKVSPLKNFLSCSACGKRFTSEKMLNVHKSYCRSSQFACEMCDRQFVNMFSLKKHRILQACRSPGNSLQYRCNACKKVFSDSSELKNHEEFHDDLKLFKCTKCPTEFKSELCLKRHKRIHR